MYWLVTNRNVEANGFGGDFASVTYWTAPITANPTSEGVVDASYQGPVSPAARSRHGPISVSVGDRSQGPEAGYVFRPRL